MCTFPLSLSLYVSLTASLLPGCAELFYTERAHLRMLKVLDNVFYQRMTRESILPPADIKNIFTNLEEIVQLHGT